MKLGGPARRHYGMGMPLPNKNAAMGLRGDGRHHEIGGRRVFTFSTSLSAPSNRSRPIMIGCAGGHHVYRSASVRIRSLLQVLSSIMRVAVSSVYF